MKSPLMDNRSGSLSRKKTSRQSIVAKTNSFSRLSKSKNAGRMSTVKQGGRIKSPVSSNP